MKLRGQQLASFLMGPLTWRQLLRDVVCRGSSKLCVLDAVDVLHHGLGHLEHLFAVDVALSFLPLLQEQGLHLVLEDVDGRGHVQLVQAHLEGHGVALKTEDYLKKYTVFVISKSYHIY